MWQLRFIRLGIGALVLVHFTVACWHGLAHGRLSVGLSLAQSAFVNTIIVLLPFMAATLIWTVRRRTALWIFILAMSASLIFGLYYHYVAQSPDNVSCLPPGPSEWQQQFRVTAMALAGLEFVAVLYGVIALRMYPERAPSPK